MPLDDTVNKMSELKPNRKHTASIHAAITQITHLNQLHFYPLNLCLTNTVHCVSKNEPSLASCSFDKHAMILSFE